MKSNSTHSKIGRRRRRRGERGAAMVEAIVVMTTMLVFLGMNMWAYDAYGGKIDQANSTRRDALYYGSHQCAVCTPNDPDTYTQGALKQTNCGGANGALSIAKGLFEAVRGGSLNISDFFGNSRSNKGPINVVGTAVVITTPNQGIVMSRVPLTARVATNSVVGCNEKPYSGRWTAIFSFGLDFFKSLVR